MSISHNVLANEHVNQDINIYTIDITITSTTNSDGKKGKVETLQKVSLETINDKKVNFSSGNEMPLVTGISTSSSFW
jgi:hypothetical protein